MKNGAKEITVTFNTLTPIWTGNAWGECKEIRPSSLIGSLRFWFAFYCEVEKKWKTEPLDDNRIPNESLAKLEKPKENKTLKILIKNYLKDSRNLDEAIDKALDDLDLSIPSRIFGCTGWKSRVQLIIENFSVMKFNFGDIDVVYPLDKLENFKRQINSKFWIRKLLFNENTEKPVSLFANVKVQLTTNEYWWDEYLKGFFEFFRDKIILIGGKKSFGFGFTNLIVGNEDTGVNNFQSINELLLIEEIKNINYPKSKKVLGFNFRYYLRLNENKKFRRLNFGERGIASKVYVSNLLEQSSNKRVYFIVLNNPFDTQKIPNEVIKKYRDLLNQLSEEGGRDE